jgi:hypothetical protein
MEPMVEYAHADRAAGRYGGSPRGRDPRCAQARRGGGGGGVPRLRGRLHLIGGDMPRLMSAHSTSSISFFYSSLFMPSRAQQQVT